MNYFKNLGKDLPAGLVVFLVAIPLCLGIALGSEVPPFSGLIAGIVGGIVVGVISNSRIGVSGPAAGLIAIIITAMATFKSELIRDGIGPDDVNLMALQMLGFSVLIAGVFQMLLGFVKAGIIAYYFPNVVIKGMLSAIGLILIKKQLSNGFGYDKSALKEQLGLAADTDLSFWQEIKGIFMYPDQMSIVIIGVTVVSLLILILWETKFIKKSFLGLVPGAVLVVGLGIVFVLMTGNLVSDDFRVNLGISGKNFSQLFAFPLFEKFGSFSIWITALTIAIVASIETLLCVEATDKIDHEKHVTNPNRELIAQGAGNIVSGSLGGLPITQVIVRSSANISAGGKTKTSAIFHGILIVASIALIPNVLNLIPYASLAAILFVVGYKLAKPALFALIFKKGWEEFLPFVATIIGILATDLLKGIGIGLAFSIFYILKRNYNHNYEIKEEGDGNKKVVFMTLSEEVTFLNKASVIQYLHGAPEGIKMIIDGTNCKSINHDILEAINSFKESQAKEKNIRLELINIPEI
jgi:MFS superfamily sulfate permease-like transporter